MGLGLFARLRLGSLISRLVASDNYVTNRSSLPSVPHRQGAQISPGENANYRCINAAFTVGCVPVGFAAMCHRQQHPSALTMRFLSVASHLLHAGILRTIPRGFAVAFGACLSLLTLSTSRYSHRGLPPHKFAPMPGAHHSLNWTYCGGAAFGLQKPSPNTNPPQ